MRRRRTSSAEWALLAMAAGGCSADNLGVVDPGPEACWADSVSFIVVPAVIARGAAEPLRLEWRTSQEVYRPVIATLSIGEPSGELELGGIEVEVDLGEPLDDGGGPLYRAELLNPFGPGAAPGLGSVLARSASRAADGCYIPLSATAPFELQ